MVDWDTSDCILQFQVDSVRAHCTHGITKFLSVLPCPFFGRRWLILWPHKYLAFSGFFFLVLTSKTPPKPSTTSPFQPIFEVHKAASKLTYDAGHEADKQQFLLVILSNHVSILGFFPFEPCPHCQSLRTMSSSDHRTMSLSNHVLSLGKTCQFSQSRENRSKIGIY